MMTGAPFESLDILMKTCSQWLSFIILRHLDQQQKAQFRIFEVLFEKITNLKNHQIFNETYILTCIYEYIYILVLNLSLLQNERENEER